LMVGKLAPVPYSETVPWFVMMDEPPGKLSVEFAPTFHVPRVSVLPQSCVTPLLRLSVQPCASTLPVLLKVSVQETTVNCAVPVEYQPPTFVDLLHQHGVVARRATEDKLAVVDRYRFGQRIKLADFGQLQDVLLMKAISPWPIRLNPYVIAERSQGMVPSVPGRLDGVWFDVGLYRLEIVFAKLGR
jgi:hypothetical protein